MCFAETALASLMTSNALFSSLVGIHVVVCLKISSVRPKTLRMSYGSVAVVKTIGTNFRPDSIFVR